MNAKLREEKLQGNYLEWHFQRDKKEDKERFARYYYNEEGANVSVTWTTNSVILGEEDTIESFMESVAFHEVAEIILFGKLRKLASQQRYDTREINRITHEALHKISALLGINHGIKLKSNKS